MYSSSRQLFTCDEALEAKLEAWKEGLVIALHRTNCPIQLELHIVEAVMMLQDTLPDRLRHMVLVREIHGMMKNDTEILVSKISRSQSKVSHYLATYG